MSHGIAMLVSSSCRLGDQGANLFVVCIVFKVCELLVADNQLGA